MEEGSLIPIRIHLVDVCVSTPTTSEYFLTFVHATKEAAATKLFHLELFENNRQFCICSKEEE